jgi:hypothetical protein
LITNDLPFSSVNSNSVAPAQVTEFFSNTVFYFMIN